MRDERNHALGEKAEADRQRGLAVESQQKAEEQRARAEAEWQRAENEKKQTGIERDRAQHKEREAEERLDLASRHRFTAQLWRVGGLWDSDPTLARRLLHDPNACPPGYRDFTWHYLDRLCQYERCTLPAGWVTDLAFSPDGKLLASASARGALVWDLARRTLLPELRESESWARCAAVLFLHDGKTLVWAGDRNTSEGVVRFRACSTGPGGAGPPAEARPKTLAGHVGKIGGLDLHPTRNLLAVGCYTEGKVTPWHSRTLHAGGLTLYDLDAGTQRVLLRDQPTGVISVLFSPDGKYVAAGISAETRVKLWDVQTGQLAANLLAAGGSWRNPWLSAPTARPWPSAAPTATSTS